MIIRLDEKEEESEFEEVMDTFILVKQKAKQLGFGKGKPGQAEMDCPICLKGKIRFSIAGYNGHCHAICSTPKCFGVME